MSIILSQKKRQFNFIFRFLRSMPISIKLSFFWLLIIFMISIFADVLRPYPITQLDLMNRLASPGFNSHLLGTDELGRDILSRLIESIRVSMQIAFGATICSAVLGTFLGFLAARFRGIVENCVMMLADFQAAMPFLILALSVLAFIGNSIIILTLLLGLYGWERYARIARGLALSANSQGYAGAVRQLGARPLRIYVHHILPNIASTLIVSMTLIFPEIILLESSLSFLGLGVQPPMSSLGNMISFGREYLSNAPWIMFAPSLIIILTTMSVSFFGDWVRDKLDHDS